MGIKLLLPQGCLPPPQLPAHFRQFSSLLVCLTQTPCSLRLCYPFLQQESKAHSCTFV